MVRVTWINGTFLFGRPQLSDNVTYKTLGIWILADSKTISYNDYLQYLDLLLFTFEKWGALKWHWFNYNRVDSSLWACSYCLITYYDYMAYKYVTIISIVPINIYIYILNCAFSWISLFWTASSFPLPLSLLVILHLELIRGGGATWARAHWHSLASLELV